MSTNQGLAIGLSFDVPTVSLGNEYKVRRMREMTKLLLR